MITERHDAPLLVMNGDLLTNVNFRNLLTYHKEHTADATVCVREIGLQVPFGVIQLDQARVKGIVSTADERLTERITTLHLPLGDEIAVEARNDAGDWVITLPDGKRLTVDHEMADAILVEVRQVSNDRA